MKVRNVFGAAGENFLGCAFVVGGLLAFWGWDQFFFLFLGVFLSFANRVDFTLLYPPSLRSYETTV